MKWTDLLFLVPLPILINDQIIGIHHDKETKEWLLVNKFSKNYRSNDQVLLIDPKKPDQLICRKIVATEYDSSLYPLIPLIPRGHFMYKSPKPQQSELNDNKNDNNEINNNNENNEIINNTIEKHYSDVTTIQMDAQVPLQQPNFTVSGPFPIGYVTGKVLGSIWPL